MQILKSRFFIAYTEHNSDPTNNVRTKRTGKELMLKHTNCASGASSTSTARLALERGGTRDNLNQLGGDSGLAGSVILQVELAEHLAGILGGVLHGAHAG